MVSDVMRALAHAHSFWAGTILFSAFAFWFLCILKVVTKLRLMQEDRALQLELCEQKGVTMVPGWHPITWDDLKTPRAADLILEGLTARGLADRPVTTTTLYMDRHPAEDLQRLRISSSYWAGWKTYYPMTGTPGALALQSGKGILPLLAESSVQVTKMSAVIWYVHLPVFNIDLDAWAAIMEDQAVVTWNDVSIRCENLANLPPLIMPTPKSEY